MNSLSTLYLPDTGPDPRQLAGLLLFFDSIFHYLPVEAPANDQNTTPATSTDLCTAYAPAPCGSERDRFLRLVADFDKLRNAPGQLSTLSLAALAARQHGDPDEISSGAVFSALTGSHERQADRDQEAPLWQARLVLKLAETLDRQEREIEEHLADLSTQKQVLFETLKGPLLAEENEIIQDEAALIFAEFAALPTAGIRTSELKAPPAGLDRQRLVALARLFFADQSATKPAILSTARQDVAEALFDAGEKLTKKPPVKLLALALPALDSLPIASCSDDDFLARRTAFRRAAEGNLADITACLRDAAVSPPPMAAEAVGAWRKALTEYFPAGRTGGRLLTFYRLPDISSAVLFRHLAQEKTTDRFKTSTPAEQGILLAVVSRP